MCAAAPMRPSSRLLAFALFLGLAGGCSRCGSSTGGGDVLRLLPQKAQSVILVPDVHRLGERVTQLQGMKLFTFAAQLQGLSSGAAYATAVFSQLGLDPRSPQSLEKAGIDGARGAGVAVLDAAGSRAYSVVAVKDAEAFKGYLTTLAKNRLGASTVGTATVGGATLTTFSNAAGRPALGYLVKDGFALVAPAESFEALAAAVALTKETSLAGDAALAGSLKVLPAAREVVVYLPPGSSQLPNPAFRSAALAVEVSSKALVVTAHVPLSPPEAAALVEPRKGPSLEGSLPKDAFAVLKYSGDPLLLAVVWPRVVTPRVLQAFAEAGVDVKAEVLDNLQPGWLAALALSPNVNLGGGVPELDVRRTNPFRYLNLVAVAQVKDGAKGAATLAKVAPLASSFGATLTPTVKGGKTVYETTYSQGEGAHVALEGQRLLVASPMKRMEEALAAGAGGEPLAKDLLAPLEGQAVGVVVDLQKLASAVRELPASAWGLGGFAIKASALRWLEGMSDLRALSVTARSQEGALVTEVRLRFTAP